MGSNICTAQETILKQEFDCATVILDPDEAGQKLRQRLLQGPVPLMPVRIVEPKVQVDSMTGEQIKAVLR